MYKVTNISKQVLSVPVQKNSAITFIRLLPNKSYFTDKIINHGNLSVYLKYEKIVSESPKVVQRKSSVPKLEVDNIEKVVKGEG